MNERKPQRKPEARKPEAKAANFDPIALSLAVWLGLMVGVLGLQRMSEEAAAQQAAQHTTAPQAALAHMRPGQPAPPQAFALWDR
ncbi:MAG: hypothetical protein JO157_04135 [Acetobacteraceae bacterium]|nr:hypothetical protein [Acetobacteraceae bacterium]